MFRMSSASDRTIASLTAEVEQWKLADATKAEQIATTKKQVDELQRDLSASTSQFAELQRRYEAQSRDFIAMRNELRTSSSEDKDRTVAALTAQVEEWKRKDALKEEHIGTIRKQTEDLQRELTSTSSQVAEVLQRYELQSRELGSLRDQLQDKEPGNDRYISSLIPQVEGWKRSDATKGEELVAVRKDLAELRRDLVTSSSQIEGWKRSDATKTADLTAARKDIEQLRRDLSTSSSQIAQYQQRYSAQSAELATARKKLEQLQIQVERYKEQSRDLKSQLDDVHRHLNTDGGYTAALREQLRDCRSQLDAVQRFITTADIYADTMIIQMLQKLNTEVQQNTVFMAECILEGLGPRATKLTKEQGSAAQRVSQSIGQALTGCLSSKERNDVALYLQIAFQAYLTYHLHSVIPSWTVKKDRNEFINEIYEQLQKSGKKYNFECHQHFC